MDSLLRYAYVEEPCNSCGGHFTTTLLDALMEHRLHKEWNPPRPCSVCAGENSAFSARLSRELLEQLDSAWQAVRDEAKLPATTCDWASTRRHAKRAGASSRG
jgi:hypothetical protein